MKQMNNKARISFSLLKMFGGVLISFALLQHVMADETTTEQNDNGLLDRFIQSEGQEIIVFDPSNIKMFWIDNSVISEKDSFRVLLTKIEGNKHTSDPLKIQLANVKENQNCTITIVSKPSNYSFAVLNNNSRMISSSSREEDFLQYSVVSATIPLEKASNFSFSLKFNSDVTRELSLKRIILSFSENKASSFLSSPGEIILTDQDMTVMGQAKVSNITPNSFSVTGIRSTLRCKKYFYTTDNTLSSSVTVKNTGDCEVTLYIGYSLHVKDYSKIDRNNYPYKDSNQILKVISSSEGSDSIVVDSYPDYWQKGCWLALNAMEDMSDIPNFKFIDGRIADIKKEENGYATIKMDTTLKTEIKKGTKIRVHGLTGTYLYTGNQTLKSGEEHVFTSAIRKTDSIIEDPHKAMSKAVYYAVPVIVSISADSSKESSIIISDFKISY